MLTDLFGGKQSKKQTGDAAERAAERYLIKHGLKLVMRNFRTRFGEIDLIMRDGDTLVFVEVRMRSAKDKSRDFGGAAASIGAAKQARLIAAAQQYLADFKDPPACRFDALLLGDIEAREVEWIKNAFGV
jgi:putative endonuclease